MRFAIIHWLFMGIGGRIPPLLAAVACLFHRILPWFDLFVMHSPSWGLAFPAPVAMPSR